MSDPSAPNAKPPCGPHVELARSEGVRVMRCPCGTVHLHITRTGVSLQLAEGHFDELVQVALKASRAIPQRLDEPSAAAAEPRGVTAPRGSSGFVTVVVPGAKKGLN